MTKYNEANVEYVSSLDKMLKEGKTLRDKLRVELKEIYGEDKLPASRFSIKYWRIRGFSEEESIYRVKEIQGSHTSVEARTKKLLAKGIDVDEVRKIIDSQQKELGKKRSDVHKKYRDLDPDHTKKQSRLCKEFWIEKGFSEEAAIEKAHSISAENRKKFREKLDAGKIRRGWNNATIDYYLNKGMSTEDAAAALTERQKTFSLEKCIEKFGEEEGRKKWTERQEKWKKSVFNTIRWIGGGKSVVATSLFEQISSSTSMFGANEKFITRFGYHFKYDFCESETKKIIEFHGDYWHCHPSMFDSDYWHVKKQMRAIDIWEFDERKKAAVIAHGYEYYVVWEHEYKLNPEGTIINCKNFLNANTEHRTCR
jgi:G:T-mismatch repair DNA endonuclease (very short patch repair protein)